MSIRVEFDVEIVRQYLDNTLTARGRCPITARLLGVYTAGEAAHDHGQSQND